MAVEERKFKSKSNYLLAFLIGTLIFLLGFTITYAVSFVEYKSISNSQQAGAYSIFEDKLQYTMFNKTDCKNSFAQVSSELAAQGQIIDDLERKFGKNDPDVLFRKKFYTLAELEHLDFLNIIKEQCNLTNINTILFFYSNSDADLDASENAGRILDVLPSSGKKVVIYSFDINLNSSLISSLKEKYGIEKSPTIIINEKDKILMPASVPDIQSRFF